MDTLIIRHDCPAGNTDPENFLRVTWQGLPLASAVMCGGCARLVFGVTEDDEQTTDEET